MMLLERGTCSSTIYTQAFSSCEKSMSCRQSISCPVLRICWQSESESTSKYPNFYELVWSLKMLKLVYNAHRLGVHKVQVLTMVLS
jgi:hypothetical protein